MAPVDRDYALSGIYYSALVRNTCQYSGKYDVYPNLVQCWRWPSSKPVLVQRLVFAGLRSIAAGLVLPNTAGGDYKRTPTQCLLNVGSASVVLGSINSVLVSTSCCWYLHAGRAGTMLWTKEWVNVGPPSVTLAHIQRGAKHNTGTQYWANVGSAS